MKRILLQCTLTLLFGLAVATAAETTNAAAAKADAKPETKNVNTNEVAILKTSEGEMVLEFWPDVAPKHVENFKKLAKSGFYDGTCFHRVIKGFMIQGGDPNTKDESKQSQWGMGGPGYKINAEFNDKPHVRGVLSMARSNDPNSAGSQFFICHGDPRFLGPAIHRVWQVDQRRRRAGKNCHHAHRSPATGRQAHECGERQNRGPRGSEVIYPCFQNADEASASSAVFLFEVFRCGHSSKWRRATPALTPALSPGRGGIVFSLLRKPATGLIEPSS
jgi:peptidyl-prolyl cis-trans isomerase B (cyclophilin B)